MPEITYDDDHHKNKREYMRKYRATKGAVYESINYYKRLTNTKARELKPFTSDNDKLAYLKTKSFLIKNQLKFPTCIKNLLPINLP